MNPYYVHNGDDAPPPPHPDRVQTFIMGCALFADEREAEMAGAKVQRRSFGG
jgi:hypothetical protein